MCIHIYVYVCVYIRSTTIYTGCPGDIVTPFICGVLHRLLLECKISTSIIDFSQ